MNIKKIVGIVCAAALAMSCTVGCNSQEVEPVDTWTSKGGVYKFVESATQVDIASYGIDEDLVATIDLTYTNLSSNCVELLYDGAEAVTEYGVVRLSALYNGAIPLAMMEDSTLASGVVVPANGVVSGTLKIQLPNDDWTTLTLAFKTDAWTMYIHLGRDYSYSQTVSL